MLLFAGCSGGDDLAAARGLVENATAEMSRAQDLQRQGKLDEANAAAYAAQDMLLQARNHYLAASADRSRKADVLVEFAEFSERMEDPDLAGEAYARAARIEDARADLWFRAARNFVDAGGRYLDRVPEALDAVERANASAAKPVSLSDLETVRGEMFLALGLPDQAAPRFAAALEANPEHVRARIGGAGAALQLGEVERAADWVDGLGALDARAGALLDRVLRQAYLVFRRDRVAVPETARAQRALAKICVRLGFLREGLLAIERAVELDGGDVFSWNMIGSLAHEAGDVQRAREAFTRSLSLAPDQPRTKQELDELGGPVN